MKFRTWVYALVALLCWSQVLAAGPSVNITWAAPTANADGTAITGALTYQLYSGASGAEVKTGTPVSASPYVLSAGLTPGKSICVQLTAIANGVESDKTPEACATVPFPKPKSPTTVTVTIKLT